MKKLIFAVLFSAVLVFGMTTAALAKEGFYLGLQIPYNMVDGDFDNTTAPEVDPGAGFGLIAGYTFIPSLSIEIDWSGSSHKSAGATIGLGEFSLNGKFSFMTNQLCPVTSLHIDRLWSVYYRIRGQEAYYQVVQPRFLS